MNEEKILYIIKKYIQDTKNLNVIVDLNSDFKSDLSLDSLDIVEIMILLEKEFNLKLPIEEMLAINASNTKDVIKFIENLNLDIINN
jgi:acyl carrier protein